MQTLEKQLAKLEKIAFGTINVGDVVGKGRFKRVHRGRFRGRDVVVLRYAKDVSRGFSPQRQRPGGPDQNEEKDKNCNELRILAQLAKKGSEACVPEIYGVCHEPHSTIIVQEFASRGTLKSLLQNASLQELASNLHRLHCANQVARAMAFLESERVVHADLSCRNVLIFRFEEAPHHVVAKVSDFGLSVVLKGNSDCLQLRQPQATRWCAPETVSENKLSHRADMWSLGVTLWEMYANGAVPWPLRPKRAEVAARLKDIVETGGAAEGTPEVGEDFPCSSLCPAVVHRVILSCLRADEHLRPQFAHLAKTWARIIEEGGESDSLATDAASAITSGMGSASRKKGGGRFELPPKEQSTEPDTPQWRNWCAWAAADEGVAARLKALRAFPEEDRQVLLDAEDRLKRQLDQIVDLKREASAKQVMSNSGYPNVLCNSQFAPLAGTPTTPRKVFLQTSPSTSSSPNTVRMESARPAWPSSKGAWSLWASRGTEVQRMEFQRDVEAWEAFRWMKRSAIPCTLRDPSGVEVASESWNAAACCLQDGSPLNLPVYSGVSGAFETSFATVSRSRSRC